MWAVYWGRPLDDRGVRKKLIPEIETSRQPHCSHRHRVIEHRDVTETGFKRRTDMEG
jgi:hypothetical protein